MSIIPSFFMDAVVAIGSIVNGEKRWIGTGFIVGRKEEKDPSLSTYYIVSNKHVFNASNSILVRFNAEGQTIVKDYNINLVDESGNKQYSEHPNNSTDVAAIQIVPQTLINDRSVWAGFILDDHSLTLDRMEKSGVDEGSLVYVLGFPMSIVGDIKAPICRLGCISRIKDAFILKNQQPQFLIDALAFPGNSGGPVISRPELVSITGTPHNNDANLIGILSANIQYKDHLVSAQTGQTIMIREENSGLVVVHPVDRIKEVVEIEYERNKTEKV